MNLKTSKRFALGFIAGYLVCLGSVILQNPPWVYGLSVALLGLMVFFIGKENEVERK